jgi:hypothetical protein
VNFLDANSSIQTQLNNKPNLNGDNTFLNGINIFLGVIAISSSQRFREITFNKNVNGVLELGYDLPASDNNTGVIRCVGRISCNMQSWFNGILIPASSSLSIGNNVLTNDLLSYLTGITSSVQNQLNALKNPSYKSGQIIQSLKYYQGKGGLTYDSVATDVFTDILFTGFNVKSSNSSISISFDCVSSIGGSGSDIWESRILLYRDNLNYTSPPIIASKKIISMRIIETVK